jgi:CHAT domain-containing protein
VWRAFEAAERAKSRALIDMLTGVVDPASATSGTAARQAALEADLHATYSELARSGAAEPDTTRVPLLRARAAELEREIGLLRLQDVGDAPLPDRLAPALPFDAVRAQLTAEGALLAYHITGDAIGAFVWAGGELRAVRAFASLPEVQRLLQRLEAQWERFRVGGAFAGQHLPLLEQSARRALTALYTALIVPVAALLGSQGGDAPAPRQLTIVPHGPLHQAPFHALFDGERYLVDQFEIAYVPSATVLALLAGRPQRPGGRALVVGVPDPSIPAVAAEVERVAQRLDDATVLLGANATRAALHADSGQYAHLHLACHGQFRSDNPLFSALKLHDGWLTAADVLRLHLDGARVVLSACESGRSQVLGGDEILGFARAFLGAGASTLVVSLWLAQDETTAALMTAFYAGLRQGLSSAAALRDAQLALKVEHPHPFFWAPFALIGRR